MPGSYTNDGLHLNEVMETHYYEQMALAHSEKELRLEIQWLNTKLEKDAEYIRQLENELDYYKEVAHWSP